MICSICGGLVTWRGPLVALTHTECENCGGRNCQEPESYREDEDQDEDNNPDAEVQP